MNANPILVRELQQRMRGRRAVISITVYLLLITAIMLISGQWARSNSSSTDMGFGNAGIVMDRFSDVSDIFADPVKAGAVGRQMFGLTLLGMTVILSLTLPTVAATAIAGERERNTMLPILVTPMSPFRIAVGKLGSTVAFAVLLEIAAMPLLAFAYFVGGVRMGELFGAFFGLTILAVVVSAVGLMFSSISKRTLTAALGTNFAVFLLIFGTPIAAALLVGTATGSRHPINGRAPLLVNPGVLMADLVGTEEATNQVFPWDQVKRNVTGAHARILSTDTEEQFGPMIEGMPSDPTLQKEDNTAPFKGSWNWPLRSGIVLAIMVALCMAVTTRRLRTPANKDR